MINLVDYTLSIRFNPSLTSLEGLNNITSLGGSLNVQGNSSLITLEGIDSLTIVDGALEIINNDSLTSLNGLENITEVSSDISAFGFGLTVTGNNNLISLSGLENIISLEGDLTIGESQQGDPFAGANPALTNFCDIKQLIDNGQVTSEEYFVTNNAYNPSYEVIQNNGNGGCEQ